MIRCFEPDSIALMNPLAVAVDEDEKEEEEEEEDGIIVLSRSLLVPIRRRILMPML